MSILGAVAQLGDEPPPALPQGEKTHPSVDTDAERRQLTVLFADLAGSTELAVALDPETLGTINRAYQDAAKTCIERFGGYVARYMGDGVRDQAATRAGANCHDAQSLRNCPKYWDFLRPPATGARRSCNMQASCSHWHRNGPGSSRRRHWRRRLTGASGCR